MNNLQMLIGRKSRFFGNLKIMEMRKCHMKISAEKSITSSDIGKLYKVDQEMINFNIKPYLPSTMVKQYETFGELVTLIREPIVEISSCMNAVDDNFPTLRMVLWGNFGTGKTITLNQGVFKAYSDGWVIVHLKSAMELTRRVEEIEMSTYKPGRINDPINAVKMLQNFKQQNQHVWKKLSVLKTTKCYEWSKNEKTEKERPLTEIIEMGLSAPFLATDCVGALFRELKIHATKGAVKVFVAIDDANSLWGKTLVKRSDRTYAAPSDLSLVVQCRNLMINDWTNGCVLLVADKKEIADARDHLRVDRNTPLELFGEEGFEFIEPFLPIETSNYTEKEAEIMYKYYYDKNWLTTDKARTVDGKKQLLYLSAFNPHYYERLCAFN